MLDYTFFIKFSIKYLQLTKEDDIEIFIYNYDYPIVNVFSNDKKIYQM